MRITQFEKAQKFRTVNRTLQGVLFCTACVLIFFLAWKRLPMIDITTDGRYSLTPETSSYLRALNKDIEIIGSLSLGEEGSLGAERLRELQSLTARYASLSQRLKVKWIDGFRAQSEFGFKNPQRLLVRSNDHSTWVTPDELYTLKDDSFTGELAITSALWRIINPTERQVIIVASKERLESEGAWGFKRLSELFAARNTAVELLEPAELTGQKSLQADAIFVLGGNWTNEGGLAVLQRAINDHRANVFIGLDEAPGEDMVRFLYFNGLNWPAMRVSEKDTKQKTAAGEILLKNFVNHPATDSVIKNAQMMLSRGYWWALEPRSGLIDLNAAPLLKSSASSGNEDNTLPGPFVLIVAIEKKAADGVAARMIVSGGSDWLSNAYLSYRGNQSFWESSTDWLTGGNNLLSIPPRMRQARQLGLSGVQLWQMGAWMTGCCLVLLGAGIIRWIVRPR